MEILCPLRACSEIAPLLEAGARQFYAGVDSAVLFGPKASASPIINCRPWPGCNFDTDESVRAAGSAIRAASGNLYLAFNWHSYRDWELATILDFLGRHEELDGVIVADLVLLANIRRRQPRLRVILGTVAQVENSGAVEFFRRRGVRQVVLPRHLTFDEIREMVSAHPGLDFEVFIKNQDCFFSQGVCYYTHDRIDPVPYKCNSVRTYYSSRELTDREREGLTLHGDTLLRSCGVCAIQALSEAGVAAVKLVGRELPLETKLRDFVFIRRAIEALGCDGAEYPGRVRGIHEEIYGESCRRDCMY
jgi:U32 family peptidase